MLTPKGTTALLAMLLTFSQWTMATELGQTLATQGNSKKNVAACSLCHGADGGGQALAGFPRLAGLNPRYLEKQLRDFATATRDNPVMSPIAKTLSDKEIKAVSAFFAKLTPPASGDKPSYDAKLINEGKKLAEYGKWANEIPACFACHGSQADGVGEHFPALAGQHAGYIEQQLQAWRTGQRKNDPDQLMKGVAMRLSDTEIKAVSIYLASLATAGH